jgi:hypothetical protein
MSQRCALPRKLTATATEWVRTCLLNGNLVNLSSAVERHGPGLLCKSPWHSTPMLADPAHCSRGTGCRTHHEDEGSLTAAHLRCCWCLQEVGAWKPAAPEPAALQQLPPVLVLGGAADRIIRPFQVSSRQAESRFAQLQPYRISSFKTSCSCVWLRLAAVDTAASSRFCCTSACLS